MGPQSNGSKYEQPLNRHIQRWKYSQGISSRFRRYLLRNGRELTIDVPSESKGRAKHFGDKAHRQAVGLKDKEVSMEFCNGLLGTSPFSFSPVPSPHFPLSIAAFIQGS
jgi:hypothetical protein